MIKAIDCALNKIGGEEILGIFRVLSGLHEIGNIQKKFRFEKRVSLFSGLDKGCTSVAVVLAVKTLAHRHGDTGSVLT